MSDSSYVSKTAEALVLQATTLNKLVTLLTSVIQSKVVSDQEKEQFKAQALALLAQDGSNATAVDAVTAQLNTLIDAASAATPVAVDPNAPVSAV